MVRTIKYKCKFCNKFFWRLQRHLDTCRIRKHAQVIEESNDFKSNLLEKKLRDRIAELTNQNDKLKETLAGVRNLLGCKCIPDTDNDITLQETVKNAFVEDSTRRDYETTIKQYSEFCTSKSIPEFSSTSVGSFLRHLMDTLRLSTVKKRRRHLINILNQAKPGKTFVIQPIKSKQIKQKKYVLSQKEVKGLINEAKQLKRLDIAVFIEIMHTFSLRINAACSIKGSYLNGNQVTIYDSKTSEKHELTLNQRLLSDFNKVIKSNGDPDSWVFFPTKRSKNRVSACTKMFNSYLADSSLKPETEDKFTSHMFRVSKANEIFNNEKGKIMEKVSKQLLHKSSKTASHYIYENNLTPLELK